MKYIIGNLLESDVDVIAHCANCACVMGAGIAKQIAAKYPSAKQADLMTKKWDLAKLGTFSKAETDEKTIYNLYGQFGFSKPDTPAIDYNALENSMILMKNDLTDLSLKIGFPLIGAGLAGGDWGIISQIIEKTFSGLNVEIYKLK